MRAEDDDFEELVIAPKEGRDGKAKGRTFRSLLVSSVTADAFWEMGRGGEKLDRPVHAVFAGSDGEVRPFVANLLCGRPASPASTGSRRRKEGGLEFMRSAGYKVSYQRHEEGTTATVFLPELLALDPGMVDPAGVKFVVLPGAAYLRVESERMPVEECVRYARRLPVVEAENEPERNWRGQVREGWEEPFPEARLAEMVPLAYLFALYLSNRSRAPIPPDGKFYVQLLLAFLKLGVASLSAEPHESGFGRNGRYGFVEDGVERSGHAHGLAFMADHDRVRAVLAEECVEYFRRVG